MASIVIFKPNSGKPTPTSSAGSWKRIPFIKVTEKDF
jgi:hypothetical protein